MFFFFKQKTAYEMRISDWSSDVCSSDLSVGGVAGTTAEAIGRASRVVLGRAAGARAGVASRRIANRRSQIGGCHRVIGERNLRRGATGGLQRADVRRIVTGRSRQIGRASGRERVCQYV